MSAGDLHIHESEGAARSRQRMAWLLVLVVLGVVLGARAFVGSTVEPKTPPGQAPVGEAHHFNSFGTAYVKRQDRVFLPPAFADIQAYDAAVEANKGKDAGAPGAAPTPPPKKPQWRELTGEELIAASAAAPGSVHWTDWTESTPGDWVTETNKDSAQDKIQFSWPRTFGIWIAALLSLAVLSFLYKDNPAYKVAESVVVGVSAAYWMTVAFWDTLVPKLIGELAPTFTKAYLMPASEIESFQVKAVVPLILGFLLLCRLNRKVSWLGVFPLAYIVGTFAGMRFVNFTEADLLTQVGTMMKPLIVIRENDAAASVGLSVAAILVFVGVLSVLVYFFFSLEHKGVVGKTARVGIWFLMITFGASFGLTVMGRIALLAARFEYLFDDWLWITDPALRH